MLFKRYFLTRKSFFLSILLILLINPSGQAEEKIIIGESTNAKYQSDLGAFYWQKGKFNQAIEAWEIEAEIYRSQGFPNDEAQAMLKIADTRISLGQTDIAIFQLKKIISSLQEPGTLAKAWNKLGNAYSRNGDLDEALKAYQQSLQIERNISTISNLAKLERKRAILARLQATNTSKEQVNQQYLEQAEFHQKKALKYAQESLLLSQTEQSPASLTALIEWAKVSKTKLDGEQLERGRKILANLPDSRPKVYFGINWAKIDSEQAEYWLSQSVEVARAKGNVVAESLALLELGLLAEKSGNLSQALDYAYLSQLQAQSKFAFNSLYLSQWLAARIYQRVGDQEAALSNYQSAIASLDVLNQSSRNIDVERRFNFKEEIEPIYRQTLTLLLGKNDLTNSDLKEVLFFADKLRLEQLRNYFGDNCIEIKGEISSVEDVLTEKNAVTINSIILENQIYFILQLTDGTLSYSQANLSRKELSRSVTKFYKILKQGHSIQYKTHSAKLYDLIIRPFETELEKINPDTIVFIHDGVLRNIPMAVLYDGEKHLAEKWANVSSLGLRFQVLPQSRVKVAAFGLSLEREGWSSLSSVPRELAQVTETVKGRKFLNTDFTSDIFQQQLNQNKYSLVHVATHGSFGGIAENSFILAYDKLLNALELKDILSQSQEIIDLLVFSACETAVGGDFSALGLAGVALRSGVSSTLGSYWGVEDSAQPKLMKQFYTNIFEKKLNKAEALRQLQVEQIKQTVFPNIWAAFTLIGDW